MARGAHKAFLAKIAESLKVDPTASDPAACTCVLPEGHWGSRGWHFRQRPAEEADPGQGRYEGQPLAYERCLRPSQPDTTQAPPQFERRRR